MATAKTARTAKSATEAFEQVTAASTEAVRENIDRSLAALSEASSFGKQNVEAWLASATAAQKGFEALSARSVAFSKQALENHVAATKSLMTSKSVQEFVEKQNDYAKSSFEAYVAELTGVFRTGFGRRQGSDPADQRAHERGWPARPDRRRPLRPRQRPSGKIETGPACKPGPFFVARRRHAAPLAPSIRASIHRLVRTRRRLVRASSLGVSRVAGAMSDQSWNDDDESGGGARARSAPRRLPAPRSRRSIKVLLLNDDYTPMEFVVYVLERFFQQIARGSHHDHAARPSERGRGVRSIHLRGGRDESGPSARSGARARTPAAMHDGKGISSDGDFLPHARTHAAPGACLGHRAPPRIRDARASAAVADRRRRRRPGDARLQGRSRQAAHQSERLSRKRARQSRRRPTATTRSRAPPPASSACCSGRCCTSIPLAAAKSPAPMCWWRCSPNARATPPISCKSRT